MKTKIFVLLLFSTLFILKSCTEDEQQAVPVVTANPADQSIISGSSTSINLSSNVSGSSFSWSVSLLGVSGASAGNGSSIVQTLILTGTASGTATYSITPMLNGVSGNTIKVVVTVNPAAITSKVTYLADIKPLLTSSCTPCHVAGGTHPRKFDEYTSAKNNINSILDRVQRSTSAQGFMPFGGQKLAASNIELLKNWVADGLLEK